MAGWNVAFFDGCIFSKPNQQGLCFVSPQSIHRFEVAAWLGLHLLYSLCFVVEGSVKYSLVCHSHHPVLLEQVSVPAEIIADVVIRLVTTAGTATIVSQLYLFIFVMLHIIV